MAQAMLIMFVVVTVYDCEERRREIGVVEHFSDITVWAGSRNNYGGS